MEKRLTELQNQVHPLTTDLKHKDDGVCFLHTRPSCASTTSSPPPQP
jgi:hypothetical protein